MNKVFNTLTILAVSDTSAREQESSSIAQCARWMKVLTACPRQTVSR